MDQAIVMREKLSAFVITFNRASLLETCLRAVSFVDELIVVDKSSTDNSAEIAARYADRVEIVPWSPTVEETRAFASSLCQNEWILCLDDDEILSPMTHPYLRDNLATWDADILAIPYRHYILGVHDERAYYWPETRHCLFRKGAVEFIPTVHGGVTLQSDRIASIPADSGVCIHHLSYQNVADWIERTNRYTSRPDRMRAMGGDGNLICFAHDQIEHWMRKTSDSSCNDYPAAVALLRAVYDMVDRLKTWETERGLDGAELFQIAQKNLVPVTEGLEFGAKAKDRDRPRHQEPRDGETGGPDAEEILPAGQRAGRRTDLNDEREMETRAILVELRAVESQLRARTEAERKADLGLANARTELAAMAAALASKGTDFDEAQVTINQIQAALDQTRVTLDQTRTCLARTTLEADRLSGSARLFIRQYLPKFRRHFSQWLA